MYPFKLGGLVYLFDRGLEMTHLSVLFFFPPIQLDI